VTKLAPATNDSILPNAMETPDDVKAGVTAAYNAVADCYGEK
jgi:hypothetical protein